MAEGNCDPVLGVRLIDEGGVVEWSNAAAKLELPALEGASPIGLDVALDGFLIPVAARQPIWQAIEQTQTYAGDCEGSRELSVEVFGENRNGERTGVVILKRRFTRAFEGLELLDAEASGESVSLLVRALDALSAEVALLDATGQIIAVNRAWRDFARLNGYQSDDAGVGSNYLAICDAAEGTASHEAHDVARGLREVLSGQESAAYVEYPCDSPDEQRWFQVRASGFDWQGQRFAVVSHESLTESKRAEQQHRQQLDELAHQWRMSSLGELASGIAHELNQPLGAITNYMNGCLRRLEAGTISHEQLIKAVRGCAELAEFAAGVIKRMRGFASHAKVQYEPTSLNDVVAKAIQFFKASPESGQVQLSVSLASKLPEIRADDVQLQQITLNLLRNAADSVISNGATRGRVSIQTFVEESGMVCMSVTDNGHGLPDGAEGRLFEPFFSTKSKGMGLGLSISKTIAEVHGGRLNARNVERGGAQFQLCLPPLVRAAAIGSDRSRQPDADPNPHLSHRQGGVP